MTREDYISIFEKYLHNEASDNDIKMLVENIRNDEKINRFFEAELANMSDEMPNEVRQRILLGIMEQAGITTNHSTKRIAIKRKSFLKMVAVFLLPIASALVMYIYTSSNISNDYENTTVTITAPKGEKSEVVLADGSKVWINSESKISYDNYYNKKLRKVILDGEAYFEVAKDKNRPFIVVANDFEVEALGTSFNLNAHGNDSQISSVLLDGKIKVNVLDNEYILNENERLVLHKRVNIVTRDTVNATDFVQWKNGSLYFKNNSFEEIANTLSRTFNVDIRFASEELKSVRFTGTLGNSSVKNSLDILSLTSAMRYEMDGTTIELNIRK